jgi:cytochrome c-type biogenesis protein CcmH
MALFFIVLVQVDATFAQTTPTPIVTDNQVNQVAKGLYCPVCQNLPLEVCGTEACAEWRQQVRDLIAQGYTTQQIRDYFVQRFGPQTVGVPTNTTAQVLTVVLPAALILLIGAVIVVNLLIWRRRRVLTDDAPNVVSAPPADDYRTRLEEELRKRD